MEGNMLGEGVCWYKNPQICLLVALCRLEIIRLKKWLILWFLSLGQRDPSSSWTTRQPRLLGLTPVPLVRGCQDLGTIGAFVKDTTISDELRIFF